MVIKTLLTTSPEALFFGTAAHDVTSGRSSVSSPKNTISWCEKFYRVAEPSA